MLHVSAAPTFKSPMYASRKDVSPHSASPYSNMTRPRPQHQLSSSVLIVPLMNESHADLLMIPISDDHHSFSKPSRSHQHSPASSTTTTSTRSETQPAPTPAPKPQLPEGCDNWDSFLSQRKSSATLPQVYAFEDNCRSSKATLPLVYESEVDPRDSTFTLPLIYEDDEQWRTSTATLPLVYENEGEWMKPSAVDAITTRIQSPELNFKHSFEQIGWRDCLNKTQRKKANASTAKALRTLPSTTDAALTSTTTLLLPLVYDATSPGNSTSASSSTRSATKRLSNTSTLTPSSAALLRTAKRLSNASTNTANTVPCYLPSTVYKRLSGASTLTANTAATVPCYPGGHKRLSGASTLTFASTSTMAGGKPRSLRRINRARHLRAYYSDGSLLRGRRLSVGISSMQGIAEHRREPLAAQVVFKPRRSSALSGELCAPPPFPPPEKPLPSLPVVEVRELQTGERTRWRELLLRSFPRREASRRRVGGVSVR